MRKFTTIALTLLLVLAFLPAALGILAKKSLDKLVSDLVMPAGMTITLQEYTFGWLNAYAAININIAPGPEHLNYLTGKSADIIIHGNIAHGPILSTLHGLEIGIAHLNLYTTVADISGLTTAATEELTLLFKDNQLLVADSVFHLNRDISIHLQSSNIMSTADNDSIQWNGFNADIKINNAFDTINTDVTVTPMLFTSGEAMLDVAQVNFSAHLYRQEKSPWVGEQHLKIPTFYLKDATGSILRFDHLRILSASNLIDALVQATLEIEAENIDVAGEHIDRLSFDLNLENLAAEPLLALSKLMHKPILSPKDKQQLFQATTLALSRGANLQLNYLLNMGDERVFLRILADFPDIQDKLTDSLSANSKLLLSGLNAELDAAAPATLVKQTLFDMTLATLLAQSGATTQNALTLITQAQTDELTQMIDNAMAQLTQNGVVMAQNNIYHTNLVYNQGQIMLNDKPLSQDEIFLLIMLLLQASPHESTVH